VQVRAERDAEARAGIDVDVRVSAALADQAQGGQARSVSNQSSRIATFTGSRTLT
jgi:hypothetical protein